MGVGANVNMASQCHRIPLVRVRPLAVNNIDNSKFYCEVCDLGFSFKSAYERHVDSSKKHKLYAASLVPLENENLQFDEEIPSMLSPPFSSNDLEANDNELLDSEDGLDDSDESEADEFDLEEVFESGVEEDIEDYSPFPSRNFALLFMLAHSVRPIGERNLKFILHIMKQLDSSIPSLDTIKKFKLPGFIPPQKFYSSKGTPFYMNLPTTVLKHCLGNPTTAEMITRYPVVPKENLRELFHGKRWHDKFQTPMTVTENSLSIFVNDFVKFHYTNLGPVIGKVLKLFLKESDATVLASVDVILSFRQLWKVHPGVSVLNFNEDTHIICWKHEVPVNEITGITKPPSCLLRLDSTYSIPSLQPLQSQEYQSYISQHHLKAVGCPVVIAPVVLYSDDTSGNKSKKWNKFDCWCITLAGLPIHEARKFQHIHFLACSNNMPAMDMTEALVKDLKTLEEGIYVYDAFLKTQVLLISHVLCALCDNVRASELVNHLGSRAKFLCRKCMANTENAGTISQARTKELAKEQMDVIASKDTETDRAKERTACGIRETPNCLMELSVDLYTSTPVEVLHTILLGACKYMVRSFMGSCSTQQKKEILARMSSFSYCGFSGRVTGNICYYYQSFVGRDFKAWLQMAVFIIAPYLSAQGMKCWLLLSKVFQIAYSYPVQEKLDDYRRVCQMFVENVTSYMPEFAKRLKVHMLLHLVDDIVEFGPASVFNTERYEAFNSVIRAHNIYGNKHAPSRDIARNMAILEYVRYICSGGIYNEGCSTKSCGQSLANLYSTHKVQGFMNSSNDHERTSMYCQGYLRKLAHGTRPCKLIDVLTSMCYEKQNLTLRQLIRNAGCSVFFPSSLSLDVNVLNHGAVVAQSLDLSNRGDFVRTTNKKVELGVLLTCVQVIATNSDMCLIRKLETLLSPNGDAILNEFDCPLLQLTTEIYAISSKQIAKSVSVVHSCTDTCVLLEKNTPSFVERESVQTNKITFTHDLSNNIFCYNVFCTNN